MIFSTRFIYSAGSDQKILRDEETNYTMRSSSRVIERSGAGEDRLARSYANSLPPPPLLFRTNGIYRVRIVFVASAVITERRRRKKKETAEKLIENSR